MPRLRNDVLFVMAEATQGMEVAREVISRIGSTVASDGGYLFALTVMRADAIAVSVGSPFEDSEAAHRREKPLMKAVGVALLAAACHVGSREFAPAQGESRGLEH